MREMKFYHYAVESLDGDAERQQSILNQMSNMDWVLFHISDRGFAYFGKDE